MKRRSRTRQPGFTLLEVLIALTLLGLILSVLFSGLRFGARSWDTAEDRVQTAGDQLLVLNFLRRELAQTRPLAWGGDDLPPERQGKVAFVGEDDRVQFVAPLPAHRGPGGLYLFTLELTAGGLEIAYRVFLPDVLEADRDEDQRREPLAVEVTDLELAYFGPDNDDDPEATPRWQDRWEDRSKLPRLVRLRLAADETPWPELVVAPYLAGTDPVSAQGISTVGQGPGVF